MERVSGGFDFSARDLLVAVIDKLQVALHDGGVTLWMVFLPTKSDPSPAGFRGLAFVANSTCFLDQLTELRVVPLENAAIFVSSQSHLALKSLAKASSARTLRR